MAGYREIGPLSLTPIGAPVITFTVYKLINNAWTLLASGPSNSDEVVVALIDSAGGVVTPVPIPSMPGLFELQFHPPSPVLSYAWDNADYQAVSTGCPPGQTKLYRWYLVWSAKHRTWVGMWSVEPCAAHLLAA